MLRHVLIPIVAARPGCVTGDKELFNGRPKYGPNEANKLYTCPRCADAVPVFIRKIITTDNIHGEKLIVEIHCRKCDYHGHTNGSLIESTTHETTLGPRKSAAS